MNDEVNYNKQAWEYRVYEWRVLSQGSPDTVAADIMRNPKKYLRFHADLFGESMKNKKVASICGSDGRRAVALGVLGAESVVFDISKMQKKYAHELAEAANVSLYYEVGDFCEVDETKYSNYFDFAYAEGGILHYFLDLHVFFEKAYKILKSDGLFIMSDYHPFHKTCKVDIPKRNVELTRGNYFDSEVHEGHVPYYKFFSEEEQKDFPKCRLRFYTLSDIINAGIDAGFEIKKFFEHPKNTGDIFPHEYTLLLHKKNL